MIYVHNFIAIKKYRYGFRKKYGLVKIASYASVTTAIIIMLAKSYAWLATESQSILASLIDSLPDILLR